MNNGYLIPADGDMAEFNKSGDSMFSKIDGIVTIDDKNIYIDGYRCYTNQANEEPAVAFPPLSVEELYVRDTPLTLDKLGIQCLGHGFYPIKTPPLIKCISVERRDAYDQASMRLGLDFELSMSTLNPFLKLKLERISQDISETEGKRLVGKNYLEFITYLMGPEDLAEVIYNYSRPEDQKSSEIPQFSKAELLIKSSLLEFVFKCAEGLCVNAEKSLKTEVLAKAYKNLIPKLSFAAEVDPKFVLKCMTKDIPSIIGMCAYLHEQARLNYRPSRSLEFVVLHYHAAALKEHIERNHKFTKQLIENK